MSWYKKDDSNGKSSSTDSYVQVPSSSPINIKSSPNKSRIDFQPPSRMQFNPAGDDSEAAERERKLEVKRQAIRSHPDFPVVKRKYYYLEERDIFKGFVKGKGNLRDVTQWLTDNFNKDEILGKKEEENRIQRELKEKERKRYEEEKFKTEFANRARKQVEEPKQEPKQEQQGEDLPSHHDRSETDIESPVKIIRGKARTKSSNPSISLHEEEEDGDQNMNRGDTSTNVNISKPKVSILDKYKYKPKAGNLTQSRLDGLFKAEPPKKRRLVRASDANGTESESNNDDSTGSVTPSGPNSAMHTPPAYPLSSSNSLTALSKSFDYGNVPKLKLKFQEHPRPGMPVVNAYEDNSADEDENEGIVADDDLERLEEKIRENRRKARNQSKNTNDNDENEEELDEEEIELDDDDLSDGLSQEEDEDTYGGLTSIDSQILEFLNNAPQQDIIEICQVPPNVADIIISRRPFPNVYAIAEEKFESADKSEQPETNQRKRKQNMRKPLGQKIIELTEKSLKGYKAVDSLIKKCSEYGDLIMKQMETWGVTVTGEGELEVVEIEASQSKDDVVMVDDEDEDEEDDDEDIKVISHTNKKKKLRYVDEKPALLAPDVELKNYQQVGINWLHLLYQNKLSCILADEMGLGKTCQVISFMALLKERQTEKKGRSCHLVVVPASTLENWLREFQKFSPDIVVQAYYGSQKEREDLRYDLQDQEFDVLVTTYNLATGAAPDFKFLRSQPFDMIVYDEGHMLKNSTSERYTKLMRLKANFRLLLTGTPLQNNLKELVSLLAFMLPGLFSDKKDDLEGLFNQKISTNDTHKDYNPLLSQQAIAKAKTMMTPFVLRRKKDQVLKHLPAKTHRIEYCELSESQKSIYSEYMKQAKRTKLERERRKALSAKELIEANRKDPIPSSTNVMMSLRKASMHPLLFRKVYDDATLSKMSKAIMREPEYVEANQQFILEDMSVMSDYELNNLCKKFPHTLSKYILDKKYWFESGKVNKALEIINAVLEQKNKVLVFSLFTQMLDILETVLSFKKIKFLRLDGQTSVELRQDLIDQFYDDDTIPVFLLSTKAGGFGINLVVANNVIMFDQSFNPHDDRQAEDRAHRVGQEKEVLVTKLITSNTIEENMLQLAQNKLALDQSISADEGNEKQFEEKAASLFEKILFNEDSRQATPS